MDYDLLILITTILVIPAMILAIWAQASVMRNFRRYSGALSKSGETGAKVARRLLDNHGCQHVQIELTSGKLSDHYDPRKKVVRLSSSVHDSSSLAALGVAAHEVGHAVQDQTNYLPLKIRQLVIRTTRLVNVMLMPLLIIGMLGMFFAPFFSDELFFWYMLALVITFGISTLINLITLPTEFNASRRAKRMLEQDGAIQGQEEQAGVRKVLNAAALTYVAALVLSLIQFLRFFAILMRHQQRRR